MHTQRMCKCGFRQYQQSRKRLLCDPDCHTIRQQKIVLIRGRKDHKVLSLSFTDDVYLHTGASKEKISGGLSSFGLKSIVYGGVSTVAVLLVVLACLLVYYKYHQHRTKRHQHSSCHHVVSRAALTAVYKPVNPAEILASSQHSSQQELMDSDAESSSQGKLSNTSLEYSKYEPVHSLYVGQAVWAVDLLTHLYIGQAVWAVDLWTHLYIGQALWAVDYRGHYISHPETIVYNQTNHTGFLMVANHRVLTAAKHIIFLYAFPGNGRVQFCENKLTSLVGYILINQFIPGSFCHAGKRCVHTLHYPTVYTVGRGHSILWPFIYNASSPYGSSCLVDLSN